MDTIPSINLPGLTQSNSAAGASAQQPSVTAPPSLMKTPTSSNTSHYLNPLFIQPTTLTSSGKSPADAKYTFGPPGAPSITPDHSNTIYQTLSETCSIQPSSPMLSTNPEFLSTLGLPIGHSYSHQPMPNESQTSHHGSDPGTSSRSTGHLDHHKRKSKPRPPRNKSKFKRFRNAFIYYVNDQRDKVDDDTRKLKNRAFLQLMSARWKNLSEEERRPYKLQADEDKKRYEEDVKKFGKFEPQPRRYNRFRSGSKAASHKTAPYVVPAATPSNVIPIASNPTHSGGYRNIAPAQIGAQMAYPFLNNVGSQKTTLSANPLLGSGPTNCSIDPQYFAMPNMARTGSQQQQPFLAPPPISQSNSMSDYASSNNPSGLHSPIDPISSYLGSSPIMQNNGAPMNPGTSNNGAQVNPSVQGKYDITALYQQQQQQQQLPPQQPQVDPLSLMQQIPTGAPITHSYTEPMVYDANSLGVALNNEILLQQQIQQQQQQRQQQPQQQPQWLQKP